MDTTGVANRSVIVTGAGSGIGEGIALAMAKAGARVIAVDIDGIAAKRTAEGRSKREILRCLKRYIARDVYHTLRADLTAYRACTAATGTSRRPVTSVGFTS